MEEKEGKPKVSIMITSYNLESYIAQTLESVLAQETDFPVEILVGDDGSSDRTVEIIQSYIEKYPERIRLINIPRDADKKYIRILRSANNRIRLMEQAQGDYLCFLDGDDYYEDKQRLSKMTAVLDDPANEDCVMCAHNLWMEWEDGNRKELCRAKRERKIDFREYWKLMFLQANALMFRNIYRQYPPTGSLKRGFDDNMITFWLFQQGKMYYLPECMGVYRQVEGSSWNAIDPVQQAASNILGYALEKEYAEKEHGLIEVRHYPDLEIIYKNREELTPERLAPFYQIAVRYQLTEALQIFRMGRRSGMPLLKVRLLLAKSAAGYYRAKGQRALRKLVRQY